MRNVTIASAAYAPKFHPTWTSLQDRLSTWLSEAKSAGADLAVFPEYASEAGLVGTCPLGASPGAWARHMAVGAECFLKLSSDLAVRHGLYVVTGSGVVQAGDRLVNRACLISPSGGVGWQDKIIPTPYERSAMSISGGDRLRVFDTAIGRIGILICYDAEFPLLARAMTEAGADILLVPSATDLPAGHTRVRQSARARAIESQALIVQAPLLGRLADCDILDAGTGQAALFCAPDHGLPSNGILAEGTLDTEGWTIATVDLDRLSEPRRSGQVSNMSHWPEQSRIAGAQTHRLD